MRNGNPLARLLSMVGALWLVGVIVGHTLDLHRTIQAVSLLFDYLREKGVLKDRELDHILIGVARS